VNLVYYVNSTVSGQTFPSTMNFSVQTSDGLRAVGANVTLAYYGFLIDSRRGTFNYSVLFSSASTNYVGNATFTFPSPPVSRNNNASYTAVYLVLAQANYYGLTSLNTFSFPAAEQGFDALLMGQYLLTKNTNPYSWINSSLPVISNSSVLEITDNFAIVFNPSVNLTSTSPLNSTGLGLKIYGMSDAVSPSTVVAGMIVNDTVTKSVFCMMARQPNLPVSVDYYTHSFAKDLTSAKLLSSITVQRYAHIGRETYSVYLTVWRMST